MQSFVSNRKSIQTGKGNIVCIVELLTSVCLLILKYLFNQMDFSKDKTKNYQVNHTHNLLGTSRRYLLIEGKDNQSNIDITSLF
jgi:hypothetical protein